LRLLFISLALLAVFVGFPKGGFAKSEEVLRTRKIVDGWEKWLDKHNITKAAIAIRHNGRTLSELGFGRKANEPAPVASLSKAITGVCFAKLVDAGDVSYAAKLSDILPEFDSDVSMASLLRQTSGYTHDVTQKPLAYKGRDREYLEWVSRKEISRGRDSDMIGKFRYNNSNYAMLGAVIRKVTGKSYEEACHKRVFEPIGIENAYLNKAWRIMSAWGGWQISAADYLKFVDAYFGKSTVLGVSPEDLPNHTFGDGFGYGLGYFFRVGRNGGFNFWHQGAWDYELANETARFGAYFVSFDNGWAIAINHSSSTLNGEIAEIDRLLGEATHGPL